MDVIDKLREAAANQTSVELAHDDVMTLLVEVEHRIASGPAPVINVHFGKDRYVQCPACGHGFELERT